MVKKENNLCKSTQNRSNIVRKFLSFSFLRLEVTTNGARGFGGKGVANEDSNPKDPGVTGKRSADQGHGWGQGGGEAASERQAHGPGASGSVFRPRHLPGDGYLCEAPLREFRHGGDGDT